MTDRAMWMIVAFCLFVAIWVAMMTFFWKVMKGLNDYFDGAAKNDPKILEQHNWPVPHAMSVYHEFPDGDRFFSSIRFLRQYRYGRVVCRLLLWGAPEKVSVGSSHLAGLRRARRWVGFGFLVKLLSFVGLSLLVPAFSILLVFYGVVTLFGWGLFWPMPWSWDHKVKEIE